MTRSALRATPTAAAAQASVEDLSASLESILGRTHEEYQVLRRLIGRRRDALRRADAKAVAAVVDEERLANARVADLDRSRVEIVSALARRLGVAGAAAGGVRTNGARPAAVQVSDIVARLSHPRGESLAVIAALLRDEIEACRRESSVVRAAAEALAQHVTGVVQAVHRAIAGADTYGRRGRLAVAAPLRSIDLRT